ncbi:gastrula zinc finger protein xFG20-1-like isoform X2 [Sebastes umbrosus]|uniref:gastrula zinc finger protein xFG20-1-like isoform X2 n=1 Tax=Sebastes umbrosus TaxID=72105 RepID=UPI00189E1145|nr:gastrula zinc finger protein xFG20-1-like isoform X2 [Sebastes umbrosus]
MSTAMDFHSHIASIMEVLANAAVAEMCKVVEDGYALVHLEMSRSQKENEYLRRKIRGLELQTARYRAERGKAAEGSSGLRYRAERGKAAEGSSGLRYRAERGKAAEGSSGVSRAVRLLCRQNRDSLAGPSMQCRTRFLNRDPGTQQFVQKILSINLDQDPDHEVVTTTKSAEPEEEGKLLIVKVEGTMETGTTNHEAPVDTRTSSRGDAYTTTSLPAATTDARQHSETEGQRCLRSTSSAHHEEEKMHEVQGVTPEKHSPSQTLLGWQESSQTEDRERSSCSTYTAETVAGEASFSRVRTNLASGIPTISKRPQCDMNQASPATKLDTMGIKSLPCAAEDSCGGDDGAEEVTPLIGQDDTGGRSQYQPLLCIQISELPSEVMFEGNATYSLPAFNSPLVSMGAVDSQQQQIQHSWSGIRPMDNGHFSSQNHLYQASSNQNQESGSAQSQQPCLPYACTFCSRRYAHLSKLRLHERFHRGEKPHQCIQCGKSFVQACSLKRHQMVHTGERPFPCPHCGKQFSTSTNLKVHQSIHTGEKSFHCSKCGKNFSFLSNLIKHRALHTAKHSKFHRDQSAL